MYFLFPFIKSFLRILYQRVSQIWREKTTKDDGINFRNHRSFFVYPEIYILILETKTQKKLRENFYRESFFALNYSKKRINHLSPELPVAHKVEKFR